MRAARLLFLAAAVLMMGATTASADTFFGCFKNTPGKPSKVRPSSVLVNQSPICKSTESLKTWSDDTGISSCHPEEFPGTIPASTFGVINMFCASGHATGAGAIWSTPFDGANNGKIYVFPRGDDFWTCLPYNDTGSPSNIKCYMQCCD